MARKTMIPRLLWLMILLLCGAALLLADIPPVSLTWETASEVGTAGFNITRASTPKGPFEQVNATLIPAQGSEVVGATYHFADEQAAPLHRYVYRIEEVEWNGQITPYQETLTVRAGLPRSWTKTEGVVLILIALGLVWRGRSHIKEDSLNES